MAHECPKCGETCHCRGDIDDLNFGEDPLCNHCKTVTIQCNKCGAPLEILKRFRTMIEKTAICESCYEEEVRF